MSKLPNPFKYAPSPTISRGSSGQDHGDGPSSSPMPSSLPRTASLKERTPVSKGSLGSDQLGVSTGSPLPGSASRIPKEGTPSNRAKPDAEPERVKVVARIRPARVDEAPGGVEWNEVQGRIVLHRPDAPVTQSDFTFDKVLKPEATQHDVYVAGVRDVVEDVLKGYNGTVMAYGQTGAGKTYTLGNTEPSAIGMIPRCVAEIFKRAAEDPFHVHTVSMSYVQIYMELIQDLLHPESENLMIREDQNNGVFISGAHEVPVASLEECLHYLELGERNRAFAFTHLNAHSSRSHAVVMLTVVKGRRYLTSAEKVEVKKAEKEGVLTQKVKVGKLYLVDLAGSERLKKSRSVGLRATEARSINLSLTMLGMCISARASDDRHVPFRDSKLTRLLQESLGGNAKTTLIICLANAKEHVDETLQTLQFGSRAMNVKNKPVVNERIDYRVLHAELMGEVDVARDKASELEAKLFQTEEEKEQLQVTLAKEKAHLSAIMESLRREASQEVANAQKALKIKQAQLGQVEQMSSALEEQVRSLEAEKAAMAEAHYEEVAQLTTQLAELSAVHNAAVTSHQQEMANMVLQLEATRAQLAHAREQNQAFQEQSEQLRANNQALEGALQSMKASSGALEGDVVGLKDTNAALQAEASQLYANQTALQLMLAKLQQAMSSALARSQSAAAMQKRSSAGGVTAVIGHQGRACSGMVQQFLEDLPKDASTESALPLAQQLQYNLAAADSRAAGELSGSATAAVASAIATPRGTTLAAVLAASSNCPVSSSIAQAVAAAIASPHEQQLTSGQEVQTTEKKGAESQGGSSACDIGTSSDQAVRPDTNTSPAAAAAQAVPSSSTPIGRRGLAAHIAQHTGSHNSVNSPYEDTDAYDSASSAAGTHSPSTPTRAHNTQGYSPAESIPMDGKVRRQSVSSGVTMVPGVRGTLNPAFDALGLDGSGPANFQDLEVQVKRLHIVLQDMESAIAVLETSNNSQAGEIERLETELSAKVMEVADLKTSIANLHSNLVDGQGQLASRSANVESLQTKVSELTQTIAACNTETENLQSILARKDADISQLNSQVSTLDALVAELKDTVSARDQQISELAASGQDLHGQLEQEKKARQHVQETIDHNFSQRAGLLEERTRLRHQASAALTIQQAWRRYKTCQLKDRIARDGQVLDELERQQQEAARAAHQAELAAKRRSALVGANMVLDSLVVVREGVEAITTMFIARRKELEARQKIMARVAHVAPIVDHARRNAAQSHGGTPVSAGATPGPAPGSAAPATPFTGSPAGTVMGSPSTMGGTANSKASGPMSLSRSMTLGALGALQTPVSATAAAAQGNMTTPIAFRFTPSILASPGSVKTPLANTSAARRPFALAQSPATTTAASVPATPASIAPVHPAQPERRQMLPADTAVDLGRKQADVGTINRAADVADAIANAAAAMSSTSAVVVTPAGENPVASPTPAVESTDDAQGTCNAAAVAAGLQGQTPTASPLAAEAASLLAAETASPLAAEAASLLAAEAGHKDSPSVVTADGSFSSSRGMDGPAAATQDVNSPASKPAPQRSFVAPAGKLMAGLKKVLSKIPNT